jgi:predicted transcriptional regulator
MRNVTITLKDEVLRWAKIWAARHDTSVSRLVSQILEERMRREQGYEAAMKGWMATKPVPLGRQGDRYPTRDEIHDRERLR